MKIIITGATGLVGSQLSKDFLRKKHTILELDYSLGHDLRDEKFVSDYFSKEKADALINCFAINDHVDADRKAGSFLDYTTTAFREVMEVNVVALFTVCREFIRHNNGGAIVNFSSIYGYRSAIPSMYAGAHKAAGYGPSKAAVSNLTKYLSVHAKDFRINCIVPGGIENNQNNSFKERYCKDLPAGRMMEANEITPLVEFLISSGSSYVTGTDFFIDGGWNAK